VYWPPIWSAYFFMIADKSIENVIYLGKIGNLSNF
jgi:hypothetical protein